MSRSNRLLQHCAPRQVVIGWCAFMLIGCGQRTPTVTPAATTTSPSERQPPAASKRNPVRDAGTQPKNASVPAAAPLFWTADGGPSASNKPRQSLPRREVDEARAAQAGLRKIVGKRLVLYTDLPADPEVDDLCEVFDQAYPQWCDYFRTPEAEEPDWRMIGYLMNEKERFQQAGLLPEELPAFSHGFSRDDELWLYDQPSAYYRRHLLLHEGTHGFMYTRLQASATPWYIEGLAELLGTHRWHNRKLQMNYFPLQRDEVPQWGRIRLVQDDFKQNRAEHLGNVFSFESRNHLKTDAYGWCWAAAAFLDGHPRYRERFRRAAVLTRQGDFARDFRALWADDWQDLAEEWQLFIAGIEYGYDLNRSAIDFKPGQALPAGGSQVQVAADRSWQSSGLRLEAGTMYRLTATGRYQVAHTSEPWISEPQGISIRYYKGLPLGILMAALRPDDSEPNAPSGLFRWRALGREDTFSPLQSGTLYLRINDSCAELADNAGTLEVEIAATSP